MQDGYEYFDHTADIGLRVWSQSVSSLFQLAATALYQLVVENPDQISPAIEVEISVQAEDLEGLFVDWLRELIYRFEVEELLLCRTQVKLSPCLTKLRAICDGETADWTRHEAGNELKAVTYHGLLVEKTAAGWNAEVIFDI